MQSNDKQRFALKKFEGNLLICANQGHSIEVRFRYTVTNITELKSGMGLNN